MKEKKQGKSPSAFGRLMAYAGRYKVLTYMSLILSALSSILSLLPFVCLWRIFGSPDLDQSGKFSAWLQSKLVVPLLTSFTGSEKKQAKAREKLRSYFEMSDETASRFMGCFSKFKPESIRNEYYTDLLTHLEDDIHVEGTKVHFIYANKMGEKYLKRYRKYFHDPEIREFDMQHEQWLLGEERYTFPVLKVIDEFMEMSA